MLFEILVLIIAGAGAGLATGFAGLSAAVFIAPMLVSFLDVPVYEAVGIALASDVLASAVSAYTYRKEGNVDMQQGRILLYTVLFFTVVGSVIAFLITLIHVGAFDLGDVTLSYWSIIASLLLGVMFLVRPVREHGRHETKGLRRSAIYIGGTYIGLVCGFQGTGGGMMLLFVLTGVMGFGFKEAVGTSVTIMTFTALIGAACHFIIGGFPDLLMLTVAVCSTLIFARVASVIANRLEPETLGRIIGGLLSGSALVMLLVEMML